MGHAVGIVAETTFLCIVIGVTAAVVLFRPTWRIARYAVTAVHEFGHLVTAMAFGGREFRINLKMDTSGLTTWRNEPPGRIRSGVIALAGPALPPLVGAGCALGFATDRVRLGVIILGITVGLIAVFVRNIWGWLVCAVLAGLCVWAWRDGAGGAKVFMVASTTLLCLGGVRAVAEEMSPGPSNAVRDTQVAANALRLPAVVWGVVLMLWALGWTAWSTWQLTLAL